MSGKKRLQGHEGQKEMFSVDLSRDRTCNLLIRSQAPCHWAIRPFLVGESLSDLDLMFQNPEAPPFVRF